MFYRASSSANKFSVTKNQAGLYWTSAFIVRRVLEDLYQNRPEVLFPRRDVGPGRHRYSSRMYVASKNWEMVRLMLRVAGRYFAKKPQNVSTFEQWFVADRIRRDPPPKRFVLDTSY